MKYIVIEEGKIDTFTEEFDNREEALKMAENKWLSLADKDKARLVAFYVLESENPSEEAENHFDGNPIKTYK